MAWLFENAWVGDFVSSFIVQLAALLGAGILLAATVWVFGHVLFRLLEVLENSR